LYVIGILLLITSYSPLQSQSRQEDCKTKLQALLKSINVGGEDKAFQIAYTYTVEMKQPTKQTYSTNIRMTGNDKFYQLNSEDVEVYHDYIHTVVIYPKDKVITIGDSDETYVKQFQPVQLATIQDSLFARTKVKSCLSGEHSSIILEPMQKWEKTYQFKALEFELSPENTHIQRIKVELPPNNEASYIEYTYTQFEIDTKVVAPNITAASRIFDKKGNLLPVYHGYALEDVRIKR